jgi:hypothetical protein
MTIGISEGMAAVQAIILLAAIFSDKLSGPPMNFKNMLRITLKFWQRLLS